jgi:hypothetical protein
MTMKTATFCQEVESGVTQQQIDRRVNELKNLGGAIDAYAKTVGGKRYIYTVREVFDEPLDDGVNDPERAGPVVDATPPAAARGTAGAAAGGLLTVASCSRDAWLRGGGYPRRCRRRVRRPDGFPLRWKAQDPVRVTRVQ